METYSAKEIVTTLEEDNIISIPQYENHLRVNYVSEQLVGIEFMEPNNTNKHLVINEHSGKVYLIAGSADKGEVKTITLID